MGEGNLATAAASALAAAAVKAKVNIILINYDHLIIFALFKGKCSCWILCSTLQQWKRGRSSLWSLCWWRLK